jgi:protease-4
VAEMIQITVEHIYSDFTGKVALARKTTQQKIDEVGQGRIWTGLQAKERGLVDRIGNFGDAVGAAAVRAKLKGDYSVAYLEREVSGLERILRMFDVELAQAIAARLDLKLLAPGVPASAAREMASQLSWLSGLTEGRNAFLAVTHCLCGSY